MIHVPQNSQKHYLQQSRHGNNSSAQQKKNGLRRCDLCFSVSHTHTHTHTHTLQYYSVRKKQWNIAICSNMDGRREYLSHCQTDKDKYISHMCD